MNVFTIDIGGTKVALGLISHNKLIDSVTFPTPKEITVDSFAWEILNLKPDWVDKANYIGISTTGYVSSDGISSINPDTLDFPQPFPLQRVIQNLAKKPTTMINDAQAAAWYEHQQQAFGDNMAYITISTGVGGGIVINNKLIYGNTGLAGHLGHSVITDHTLCGCGQVGCVEALASGTAITKQANEIFNTQITNIELFELAKNNQKADQIIEHSAQAIATLCCNLKMMLDLDYIVIGGGVGLAPGYYQRIKKSISLKPAISHINIIPAVGGSNTCLLGAAYLASSYHEEKNLC